MTKTATDLTREAWLQKAIVELRPLIKQAGGVVPETIAVSVGFPKRSRRAIGQCWASGMSDKINHVFISPVLEDAVYVLATLVHELIHASDDCKSKHNGHFRRVATTVGLEGKMTATEPGEALVTTLKEIADELGPYPHKALRETINPFKQTTRLAKLECDVCGCIIRTTRKWIDEFEGQTWECPCGGTFREA